MLGVLSSAAISSLIAPIPSAIAAILVIDVWAEVSNRPPPQLEGDPLVAASTLAGTVVCATCLSWWAIAARAPWHTSYWSLRSGRTLRWGRTRVDRLRGGVGLTLLLFVGGAECLGMVIGAVLAVIAKWILGWHGASLDNSFGLRRIVGAAIVLATASGAIVWIVITSRGSWRAIPRGTETTRSSNLEVSSANAHAK